MTGRRVLVTEPVDEAGIALLRERCAVDVRLGLSEADLTACIGEYEALLVRSETPVTAALLERGARLHVVGRAGVGTDNIDVEAATRRGVVVVNAPTANTVAAAEHAVALMLALARHIPAADAATRAGRWDRRPFLGTELRDKTLGVIGLGRIGRQVATRAEGLAMRVVACDPYVPAEVGERLGVPLIPLDDLLAQADVVTLHVPLTDETRHLLGADQLARMKPGAFLVNAARGGVVDERALIAALDAGHLRGAAVDVFAEEPPRDDPLVGHPRIVVTPHLGGSTREALVRVAVDVARQIVAVLDGRLAEYAVNGPAVPPEVVSTLAPYVDLAGRLGRFLGQFAGGRLGPVRVACTGDLLVSHAQVLQAAVIKALLEPVSDERVTLVNAHLVARRWELEIIAETRAEPAAPWPTLLTLAMPGAARVVAGTVMYGEPRIVRVDDYWVDFAPAGHLLLCRNDDRPGMIGKVGTLLGNTDVNIAFMQVGRDRPRGRAIMILGLDDAVPDEILAELAAIPGISDPRLIRL